MNDLELNRKVGERLRAARKACGMTQCRAAEKVYMSNACLCDMEHGRQAVNLRLLTMLYGTTASVILRGL